MPSIAELKKRSVDKELHWFVKRIVQPELPQLIEALQICLNLILYNSPQHPDPEKSVRRGPALTLPVSLAHLEALKGIIVRDGAYITKMSVQLRDRRFNRIISRLNLRKPILLPQIIDCKKRIDASILLLVQSESIFDSDGEVDSDPKLHGLQHQQLVHLFIELLTELQMAKNSLQLPTDPELVFPKHVISLTSFDPELSANQALDIYISQAEVCLDLKDLHRVTEKPWCEIDSETGKSHVDKIRDGLSAGQNIKVDHDDRSEGGVILMLSHLLLRQKYDAQDYITRCVTYDSTVVMVNLKIEVLSADPVLLSAFTKLDSLEYVVSSFVENIKKLAGLETRLEN